MLAIYAGYDAEVDIWHTEKGLFTGHDKPIYKIDYSFLVNRKLWIHCKNIEAFVNLSYDETLHLVYHSKDIALTTRGYLWTAPGLMLGARSIAVMPELAPGWDCHCCYGICSDYAT